MSKTIEQQKGDVALNEPVNTNITGATLILSPDANRSFVQSWLEQKGLRVVPMSTGFQVAGSGDALSAALGHDGDIAVPDELAPHVETIYPAEQKYTH